MTKECQTETTMAEELWHQRKVRLRILVIGSMDEAPAEVNLELPFRAEWLGQSRKEYASTERYLGEEESISLSTESHAAAEVHQNHA